MLREVQIEGLRPVSGRCFMCLSTLRDRLPFRALWIQVLDPRRRMAYFGTVQVPESGLLQP